MRVLPPVKAGLPERLDALAAAAEEADGRLSADVVRKARKVVNRAGHRRRLSGEHTIVALAGATGSGKSSLFNVISRLDLARVGVRRPTTSEPLACIWGTEGAGPLLDWLGIPRRHQVSRESVLDSGEDDALDGLVLLDLPDHDSLESSHRKQVDRLVTMVDLFVWVLDPQKYADAALHDRYLKKMASHAIVTVVVLNQVDLLTPDDIKICVDDLERLLVEDGFPKVPILPMSAKSGVGVDELLDVLRRTVVMRRASDNRVGADVGDAAQALLDEAGRGQAAGVTQADRDRFVADLTEAAGVDAVADMVGSSYSRRARALTGWPATRWLGRLRRNPVRRLIAKRSNVDTRALSASPPAPAPVQRAGVDAAVRTLADAASSNAPAQWVSAIRAAAYKTDRLADTLDAAVASKHLGIERKPRWWVIVGTVQWLLFAAALVGAGWLIAVRVVADWWGLSEVPAPEVGTLSLPSVLLIVGAVLGFAIGLITRLAGSAGARRRAVVVRQSLGEAVEEAAAEIVITPVGKEVDRLESFRTAAGVAKG